MLLRPAGQTNRQSPCEYTCEFACFLVSMRNLKQCKVQSKPAVKKISNKAGTTVLENKVLADPFAKVQPWFLAGKWHTCSSGHSVRPSLSLSCPEWQQKKWGLSSDSTSGDNNLSLFPYSSSEVRTTVGVCLRWQLVAFFPGMSWADSSGLTWIATSIPVYVDT